MNANETSFGVSRLFWSLFLSGDPKCPVWLRVPLIDASAQLIDVQQRHGMMARLVKRKLCAAEVFAAAR